MQVYIDVEMGYHLRLDFSGEIIREDDLACVAFFPWLLPPGRLRHSPKIDQCMWLLD